MLTLGTRLPKIPAIQLLTLFVVPFSCGMLSLETSSQHFEKGLHHYSTGDLDNARKEFDRAIFLDPSDSASFHARGTINFELHNYVESARDYTNAVVLKPDDASAYGNRSLCYRHTGQTELACRDWQTCLEILGQRSLVVRGKND